MTYNHVLSSNGYNFSFFCRGETVIFFRGEWQLNIEMIEKGFDSFRRISYTYSSSLFLVNNSWKFEC